MKKIEAFIRPEKLEDVKEVLNSSKISGLSISEIMGCGKQKGWKNYVRGTEADVNFLPKIKLEIVVLEEQVEEIIGKICQVSKTGEVGDGKIFVYDVVHAVRIRTGEEGEEVLK